MALTKEITYDYEIRGIGNNIQQRQKTAIIEDGTVYFSLFCKTIFLFQPVL